MYRMFLILPLFRLVQARQSFLASGRVVPDTSAISEYLPKISIFFVLSSFFDKSKTNSIVDIGPHKCPNIADHFK